MRFDLIFAENVRIRSLCKEGEETSLMKKRIIFQLVFVIIFDFLLFSAVFAEEKDEWKEKPVITHIYEIEKEKLLAEWEGNSLLYQVYVDGKKYLLLI